MGYRTDYWPCNRRLPSTGMIKIHFASVHKKIVFMRVAMPNISYESQFWEILQNSLTSC